MNIVNKLDQYDDTCIYFNEPIKNNIMVDSNFIKILYSTHHFTLNGVYLLITLNEITCEKYYNKYKCTFNINTNKDIIDKIKIIEESIIKKIGIKNKIPQIKIYDQMKNGNIKLFTEINKQQCCFILKISGIWETHTNYGLTYKFIKINS